MPSQMPVLCLIAGVLCLGGPSSLRARDAADPDTILFWTFSPDAPSDDSSGNGYTARIQGEMEIENGVAVQNASDGDGRSVLTHDKRLPEKLGALAIEFKFKPAPSILDTPKFHGVLWGNRHDYNADKPTAGMVALFGSIWNGGKGANSIQLAVSDGILTAFTTSLPLEWDPNRFYRLAFVLDPRKKQLGVYRDEEKIAEADAQDLDFAKAMALDKNLVFGNRTLATYAPVPGSYDDIRVSSKARDLSH